MTVVVVVPVLVMFTLEVTTPPVGTSPKAIDEGAEASPSFVPEPVEVEGQRSPSWWRTSGRRTATSESSGVKVTGTVSVSPAASDFGSPLPLGRERGTSPRRS